MLFQGLENSLIEFIRVIADEDYAVELLPVETEYPRLVESIDAMFSLYIDRLREPDVEAKTRFHQLMEQCLDIGVLRNRLIRSTYALLAGSGNVGALMQDGAKLECKGRSRRQAIAEDLATESFEPYFQQIAKVLAELESFSLRFVGEIDVVNAPGRAC